MKKKRDEVDEYVVARRILGPSPIEAMFWYLMVMAIVGVAIIVWTIAT